MPGPQLEQAANRHAGAARRRRSRMASPVAHGPRLRIHHGRRRIVDHHPRRPRGDHAARRLPAAHHRSHATHPGTGGPAHRRACGGIATAARAAGCTGRGPAHRRARQLAAGQRRQDPQLLGRVPPGPFPARPRPAEPGRHGRRRIAREPARADAGDRQGSGRAQPPASFAPEPRLHRARSPRQSARRQRAGRWQSIARRRSHAARHRAGRDRGARHRSADPAAGRLRRPHRIAQSEFLDQSRAHRDRERASPQRDARRAVHRSRQLQERERLARTPDR